MKKSAIYVRVSTNHQIDKDSLPLQKKDMINYSKFILGIEDYEIFEDAGFSAKNTDRPAFQEMMKRIKDGEFSHLLVWKIDRVSRNLLDFCAMYEQLKKYNCTFVSKNEQFDTSSAMGEAMLKIILVFAELERKLTGERVTAVMLDRATKGLWNGAPMPLGYDYNKEKKFPEINPAEAETVLMIYSRYRKLKSTSLVRNELNLGGVKTKKGGTWTTKTISDIIRNPFYKGTYRYNHREPARGKKKDEKEWVVIEDNHPSIISKELWQECNDIMDENAKRSNIQFRSDAKTHIFSSLVSCGECGSILYGKQDKPHKDGYIPSIYACKGRYNHNGCNQKTISDSIVGEFTLNFISNMIKASKLKKVLSIDELEKLLLTGDKFNDIIGIKEIDQVYNSIYYSKKDKFILKNEDEKVVDFNVEHLKKELNKFKKALDRLEDLYLFEEDGMSKKDYVLKKSKILDKIKELNRKIDETTAPASSTSHMNFILDVTTLELSKTLIKGDIKIKPLINTIDREIIKTFVNSIISKIIIKDKTVQSITFKNGLEITFIYNC